MRSSLEIEATGMQRSILAVLPCGSTVFRSGPERF